MTKKELRSKYLTRRKELGITKAELDQKICQRFFLGFSFIGRQTIHIYLPLEKFNEIDTFPIIGELKKRNQKILVPKVFKEKLLSIELAEDMELVRSAWDISEPKSGKAVEPAAIDVVIVPLLAYDRQGHRVGYGKGFYDRFLKECRDDSLKIGLSYFSPEEAIADINAEDITITHCVTPDSIYEF